VRKGGDRFIRERGWGFGGLGEEGQGEVACADSLVAAVGLAVFARVSVVPSLLDPLLYPLEINPITPFSSRLLLLHILLLQVIPQPLLLHTALFNELHQDSTDFSSFLKFFDHGFLQSHLKISPSLRTNLTVGLLFSLAAEISRKFRQHFIFIDFYAEYTFGDELVYIAIGQPFAFHQPTQFLEFAG